MIPNVSVVIPAYNEAARLGRSLGEMVSFLEAYPAAELLIVDDGSSDGTADAAERYLSAHCQFEWRVLRVPVNRGKGHAVRQGLLAARAPVAVFSDADLSTPITELPKLVDLISDGHCDLAFGSRALDRRLIETPQPSIAIARGARSTSPCGSPPGFRSTTRNAASKRSAWRCAVRFSSRPRSMGSASMSNCCFVAHRAGLRLQEIPVRWRHEEGSKVRLSRDGPRMLADIVIVRRQMWAGHYNSAMIAATAALRERQWSSRPAPASLF